MSQSFSTIISLLPLLFLLVGPKFCRAQDEGDICVVDRSPGICKFLQNCASVYEDLLKGLPPRSVCGYNNFDPIVCCPSETPTPTTTTTTEASRNPGPFYNDGSGAKAREKCAEYAKAVYSVTTPPILSGNKAPVNVSLCAIKRPKLIVGGKKAEPKEFPHMAAVGFNNNEGGIEWSCGGTLISERFVLTAAHCTFSVDWGRASWVRVGDLNLESSVDDAKPQNIRIVERIRHPKYRRPSQYHDIGLLKLETDVKFNAWVRPSCLAYSESDIKDGLVTATGWGRVEWAGDTSSDLLKVTISLIPPLECNRTFTGGTKDERLQFGIVGDWQLCAGEFGKDTCQGDSGGPLAVINQDYYCMYTVVGVTSLGKLCGHIIPGVYTRVYNYLPWIESTVWPDT